MPGPPGRFAKPGCPPGRCPAPGPLGRLAMPGFTEGRLPPLGKVFGREKSTVPGRARRDGNAAEREGCRARDLLHRRTAAKRRPTAGKARRGDSPTANGHTSRRVVTCHHPHIHHPVRRR